MRKSTSQSDDILSVSRRRQPVKEDERTTVIAMAVRELDARVADLEAEVASLKRQLQAP